MDYGWKLVKIQGVSTSINLSRLESVGRSVMRNLMFLYSISAGSGRRAFMMVMWWVFCTFSRGEQMDTALKQGGGNKHISQNHQWNPEKEIPNQGLHKTFGVFPCTQYSSTKSTDLQSSTACTQPKKSCFRMCDTLFIIHRPVYQPS